MILFVVSLNNDKDYDYLYTLASIDNLGIFGRIGEGNERS